MADEEIQTPEEIQAPERPLPAFRNSQFNALGTIDIEIEHPTLGWIPFTANPDDIEPMGRELHAAAVAAGNIAAYVPPTVEEARENMRPLSRRQFRLGMMQIGVTSAMIEGAIASISDPVQREVAQINWEEASFFERLHPLILTLSGVFDIAADALDDAWAASLTL